jgi:hypothetical protein
VSGCWSEGELRASLDHEMPARDLTLVATHIRECARCGDLYQELAGRASRVGALLDGLPESAPPLVCRRRLLRNHFGRRWVGAVAGVAAAVAFAVTLTPHRISPPPSPAPPPFVEPADNPVASLPVVPRHIPVPRFASRKRQSLPRPPAPARVEDFVALDDQPIEAGIVVRVQLDDGANNAGIPADVILGMDGRPRAIRFVSNLSGER